MTDWRSDQMWSFDSKILHLLGKPWKRKEETRAYVIVDETFITKITCSHVVCGGVKPFFSKFGMQTSRIKRKATENHIGSCYIWARSRNHLTTFLKRPAPQTVKFGWVWTDTPTDILPRKCKLRSKFWWLTGFCNSHDVSHFAAFFIVVGAKTSIAESVIIVLFFWARNITLTCSRNKFEFILCGF